MGRRGEWEGGKERREKEERVRENGERKKREEEYFNPYGCHFCP